MAEPRTVRENANSLTSEDIAAILPHRYPFALVDRILDYEPGQWAIGRKCVTRNEEFFCGHFPGQPVMPGVLILEALAQTGCHDDTAHRKKFFHIVPLLLKRIHNSIISKSVLK